MKIGFIGPFAKLNNANYNSEHQVGAIEHQLFGLAKEMKSMGHEVVITRNWKGKTRFDVIEKVRFLNVNYFSSIAQGFNDSKFPLNHLSHVHYVTRAARVIAKEKLDVVNVSRVFSAWFALKQFCNYKVQRVFITHDNDIFVTGGVGHSKISYLSRAVLCQVNRHYDATVATTVGVKDYLEKMGLHCRAVINEAVDESKYCMGKEKGFILSAARFVPHKRLQDLIAAYSIISNRVQDDLLIIGSGPCERTLKAFANSSKAKERIHFVSFLSKSDYRKYLSQCSVFVLPSVAEAFGLVIIEAMASGKPVIARNIIGPRDIIRHGYNGLLFSDVVELARQLESILSDKKLRMRMGKNARKTVEERFTFKVVAREYLRLYETL